MPECSRRDEDIAALIDVGRGKRLLWRHLFGSQTMGSLLRPREATPHRLREVHKAGNTV
jgi:hypothetical protein